MFANVLKFYILIPHEKIGDPYFFLISIISYLRVISLWLNNIEISYICTVVTIMGKPCWSQAVLESSSWGHSVLQTPALVFTENKHWHFIQIVSRLWHFMQIVSKGRDDLHEMSDFIFRKNILVCCLLDWLWSNWYLNQHEVFWNGFLSIFVHIP